METAQGKIEFDIYMKEKLAYIIYIIDGIVESF